MVSPRSQYWGTFAPCPIAIDALENWLTLIHLEKALKMKVDFSQKLQSTEDMFRGLASNVFQCSVYRCSLVC